MSDILSRFYAACPQATSFTQEEVIDCLATHDCRKALGLDLSDAVEILLGVCSKIGDFPCTHGYKESLILEYNESGACQYLKVFKRDWVGNLQPIGEITPTGWYRSA